MGPGEQLTPQHEAPKRFSDYAEAKRHNKKHKEGQSIPSSIEDGNCMQKVRKKFLKLKAEKVHTDEQEDR